MPPTKGSWDPATSVGTTATMVAAARAIATANGDINDPFAEPVGPRGRRDLSDSLGYR